MTQNTIVCATRGGEGSRMAQLAAIQRAQETEQPLYFLFVTDPDSMGEIDPTLRTAVRDELNWMGETLLRIAQMRADALELPTQVAVREGNVGEEIELFLRQVEANLLILGAPRGTTANVFGDDAIERFAKAVQEKTAVTVEIIRPEGN